MTQPVERPQDLALTVGISVYDDPALAPLPQVDEEVRLVREALAATGFTAATQLLGGPTLAEVRAYLAQAHSATRRLVIYWTGHGVAGSTGPWLLTRDSRSSAPSPESAMSVAWLASFLESLEGPTQVVVILDSCGSGATAAEIARHLNDVPRTRPKPNRRPIAISLISATYDESQALPLIFAQSLADALRDGPPITSWPVQQAMVPPQALARAADGWLREHGAPDAQRVSSHGVEAGTDFFSNLRHNPNARDVLLAGWAYVRRRGVLDAIDGWLAGTEHGLFLLTGSMGTGKSTVVAQLAQSSAGPNPVSPSSTRSVLINLAGGLSLLALLDALKRRVGVTVGDASPELVVAAVAASGRRLLLVVDSLEEAEPDDLEAIAQRLLVPLSRTPGVHVLVAARGGATGWSESGGLSLLHRTASGVLDLDADPDAARDIARHVAQSVTATPSSPYRSRPEIVDEVAAEVARASEGVFLVASTIGATLARAPAVLEPGQKELQSVLGAGMGGAIKHDLSRFGPHASALVDLLLPLAWAEGPGLPPGELWLQMARALSISGSPITAETLDWVLSNAGFYLASSTRDGELVYRLRHRAFVAYLRSLTSADAPSVHKSITAALRPAPGTWPSADPYVSRYLASHAALAGMLSELFDDPDFMAFADPHSLGNLASRIPVASRRWEIELYLQAGPLLDGLSPALRVFVLASLRYDNSGHRSLQFTIRPPCQMQWTTAPPAAAHRLLRVGPESLESLAMLPGAGRWSLATGNRYGLVGQPDVGTIEIFDPSSTVPSHQLRSIVGSRIESLAYAPAADDSLLLCAYGNNVLEAWSMARRQLLWSRDAGGPIFYTFLIRSRGEFLLATTDTVGAARVWRATTGDYVASLQPAGGALFVLRVPLQGREVLCLGTNTGMLSFFDADTFHSLGSIEPEEVWTRAVFTVVNGKAVIVGARGDGRLEMRAALDGRLLAITREESEHSIETMCVIGSPIGRPTIATGDGALVSLWSTAPLSLGNSLAGHIDSVTALGVLPTQSGQTSLVSAGNDGTIRIWPPVGDGRSYGRATRPPESYHDVEVTELEGRTVLLAQASMTNTVVDSKSGATIGSFDQPLVTTRDPDYTNHTIRAVVAWGGDAMALTYHDGNALRMRSLANGTEYALPTPEFGARASEFTLVGDGPDALLVLGAEAVASFDVAGRLVARLENSTGGRPRIPVALTDEPLAILQFGEELGVYDVRLGTRRRTVAIPGGGGRGDPARPRVAAIDGGDLWMIYDISRDSTWFLRSQDGQPQVRRIHDGHSYGSTVVRLGDGAFAALAYLNEVLLVRPRDGSIALRIPFMGRVHDVVSTGIGQLSVIAGGCLVHIELDLNQIER